MKAKNEPNLEYIIEKMKKMTASELKMIKNHLKFWSEKNKLESKLAFTVEKENNRITMRLYENEIKKILYIVRNKDLLKRVKGLKILVSGESGTGKTTFVKKMIELLPKYERINFSPENLVSPKMGQTQLNILKLTKQLENKKAILFIDEADSIISNRFNNQDITEYHRITSSFIKMLDMLGENVIVFFATNLTQKIDPSIIRRMNFKVNGKKMKIDLLSKFIMGEVGFKMTNQKLNILKAMFKQMSFLISDVNHIANEIRIFESMNQIKSYYTFIVKLLIDLGYEANFKVLKTKRMQQDFKKEGIRINDLQI